MTGRLRSLAGLALLLLACHRVPTPERACARFLQGVREGDAALVFDNLLQTTQWSIYTVAKVQAEMRALIQRSYPPAERQQALLRLPGGEASGDGPALFRALYGPRYARDLQARLGSGAPQMTVQGEEATCRRAQGQAFRFARGPGGRWGLAELDGEWELAKVRAIHDLDTVRENARLYERKP